MTHIFRAGPKRSVDVTLQHVEVAMLEYFLGELIKLLAPAEAEHAVSADPLAVELGLHDLGVDQGPVEPPKDAGLARLFPSAYPEDDEASAEFRRYTEGDLRNGKRDRAKIALTCLNASEGKPFSLSEEQAQCLLGALNDVRLVLGARFGLKEDGQEPGSDLAPDDPAQQEVPFYHYLGYLQEMLLEALPR